MENQPLCINIDNNINFMLKSGFIHLLPIFNGLAKENPHTYLKEFHIICIGMKPYGGDEEQVKLKVVSFSLKKAAKTWLFPFSLVLLELGMIWKIFSWRSISQHFELPIWGKKYVGFDNLMGKHSPSIGKDLSSCAINVLIIKYPISYSFNTSINDWCLLTAVSLMWKVKGH